MKLITEPTVYLVGRQEVDDSELQRFLDDHAVSGWETDTEVGAEVLSEAAGRTCYMSFSKPRPGGNAAYLGHIKEVGHGCYDADTDVLTLAGWKAWPDVTEDDRLATLNPQTRLVEYHKPVRLVRYLHTGRMYRVESQQVDLLVTPDHQMYACPTTTLLGRQKQEYTLVKAAELQHISHAYMKGSDGSLDGWWANCPGRDEFALLGFAIGDGSTSGKGSRTVRFRLRRERKIAWLRSVCERLKLLGYTLDETGGDRYTVGLPSSGVQAGLMSHLFGGIYDEHGEKQIPYSESVFSGASRAALEGLFEGLMQSDGHEGETGDSFDTTSSHLPGQFQQLCLHIGLAANLVYTYGPEDRPSSFGDKPLTRLGVIRRCLKPEVNKWSGCDGRTSWVEGWHGEVFCAEVPNNILYVRRNGKPVWSGNSVLEHSVYNLLITGVSRSLTHELVRHRAGLGFSQLSQRYVDESVAEYVVPPDLQEEVAANEYWTSLSVDRMFGPHPERWAKYANAAGELNEAFHRLADAGDRWVRAVDEVHCRYVWLSDYLAAKWKRQFGAGDGPGSALKTESRKYARQTARSILPNATETKIFVTMNARAARHFIEQRGSRHAEPEIRILAGKVLEVLQRESQNLFNDYRRTSLLDGTFELETDYRKV